MNDNPLLGQVLGSVLGGGGLGGMLGGGGLGGGGLGGILGSVLGNRSQQPSDAAPGAAPSSGNHSALLLMLLPLAMRWVQRNGGIGAVLDKFRQNGLGAQAQSWVGTGSNQPVDSQAVQQVVGDDELRQMAQRLGVPEQQVAQAFAQIMPQMVDKLTPQGQVPQQADDTIEHGARQLEQLLGGMLNRGTHPA
jgi:uncharacterized protein YidB (DUF937 family)